MSEDLKTFDNRDPVIEKLAEYAHDAWSNWMEYLFKISVLNPDGTYTIPRWAVKRWIRQMHTQYQRLPEIEKESDRKEAKKILEIVEIFYNLL